MSKRAPIIGIDCRFAETQSGIGRYTRELVAHLLKRADPWRHVFFVRDAENHGLGELPAIGNFQLSIFNFQLYSLHEQLHFPEAMRRTGIGLLHVPHFNVPLFCHVPVVATIHDIILHRFPNEASLPKRLAYRALMRHAVGCAAHIIAVSKTTANEIATTYGESVLGKISAIHEGVSSQFQPQLKEERQRAKKKYGLSDGFLLYVGNAKEHKNVQTLINACPPDRQLALVTSGRETARLKPSANARVLTNVDDDDLPALYSASSCYIQPSLAEGFCLPILEAMACGCRVIASNRGSIPEIARGHSILVEPTVEGIARGIDQALKNPRAVSRAERAAEHARSFSWETMAEETAKIYARVLNIER